jgi:hypothetical protein
LREAFGKPSSGCAPRTGQWIAEEDDVSYACSARPLVWLTPASIMCGLCAKEDSASGSAGVILGGVKAHDTTLAAASKMAGTVYGPVFVLFPLLVALIAYAAPLNINDHDEKVLRSGSVRRLEGIKSNLMRVH